MKLKSSTEIELDKRFGQNVKALAKAYQETNEELAEAININPNTLSQYIRGERTPGLEVLIACSDHYKMQIDYLLKSDLKSLDKMVPGIKSILKIQLDDKKILCEFCDAMLFWITSDDEESDAHLRNATTLCEKIIQKYLETDELEFSEVEKCIDFCEKAGDAGNIFGIANQLWWIFLMGMCINNMTPQFFYNMENRHIVSSSTIYEALKKGLLCSVNDDEETDEAQLFSKVQREFYIKYGSIIKRNIVYLKSCEMDWASQLGDYYLAFSFIIGLAISKAPKVQWRTLGMEMMDSFETLGNKYAKSFNEYINRLFNTK